MQKKKAAAYKTTVRLYYSCKQSQQHNVIAVASRFLLDFSFFNGVETFLHYSEAAVYFKTQTHTHTHQISPIRVLNSLHGSRLGHNILLFVERLSSCVTSAKNTTPPLPTPPSQLSLLPPSLPAQLTLCFSISASDPREGRGGEARVGGTLIQGVLLTSAGRE